MQVGGFDPRDPLLDDVWARLEETGTPVVIHCGSGPLAGEHTGPEPMTGLLERYPRLQLVIAHLGMPEYREFLDLAERYERVHLDTTMFATDFTERLMPFDPRRAAAAVGACGTRCSSAATSRRIPYAYAHQLAGAAPAGAGGGVAARRPLGERRPAVRTGGLMPGFTLTAAVLGTPDPRGLARFYQRLLGWPIRDDDRRVGDAAAGRRQHRAVLPAGGRPRAAGLAARAGRPSRCSSTSTSRSTTSPPPARSPRRPAREPVGGHEDDDEIVRVFRDPAGHPFCLFVRR